MKYALNHPWKFTSYKTAFFAGLIQVLVIVAVESATFYILVFASDAVFDVLANYAIVLVIADFKSGQFSKICWLISRWDLLTLALIKIASPGCWSAQKVSKIVLTRP